MNGFAWIRVGLTKSCWRSMRRREDIVTKKDHVKETPRKMAMDEHQYSIPLASLIPVRKVAKYSIRAYGQRNTSKDL